MSAVRQSLLLSMLDSYLGVVLHIASTVIISRLLTPAEVGVFAIAAVFSALASTFRDFGVAEYLIQERELTHEKIRAAFALNIIVSWSMAVLLFAGSFPAAVFYRQPGVGEVMRILAMSFVLVPFGAVTHAWFRRELNYRPIVICNALSSVAAFAVAIGLALAGFGPLALAWSTFSGIVVVVLATAFFRPADFPRWPSLRGIGHAFHFGKFASLIYIFAQLGKGAPELIIGRARGPADVGLFSRANGLVEVFHRLVIRPVMSVVMPYFARQDREQGTIAPAYAASVSMVTAVGWPFLAVMAVLAFPAIRIIYGDQWLAAVPVAQVLCLACAVELLFLTSREALLACGQARRAGTLQVQIVVPQLLGLCLVFPYGLLGAAWGLVGAAVAGLALSQWQLRAQGVRSWPLWRACWRSAVLATVCALPLALALGQWPVGEHNYLRWAAAGAAWSIPVFLLGLWALKHPLWAEVAKVASRYRRSPASTP